MLTLHDYLSSGNGFKVRLLLTQLGLPFRRIDYDIDKSETRTPEFLLKNPNGRIPVLELDDGSFLSESDAILFYLAEGTAFLPDDRRMRAEVLQWMFFEQYEHEPNVATVRYWITHKSPMTPLIEASLPAKRSRGEAALGVMEKRLTGRAFLVGERYTIADIALYAYTHVAEEGGFSLAAFPQVRAWLARVAAQPRYRPITKE